MSGVHVAAWMCRRGEKANRRRLQGPMRNMGQEAIHLGPRNTTWNFGHESHLYIEIY